MAAIFAGASRALLTSVVFAFETTQQPHGLLPLLGGCAAAYLVSALMMRNTIMTEKIARRGVRVPTEYSADYLEQVLVRDACSRGVVSLRTSDELGEVRRLLASGRTEYQHQGFPVVDEPFDLVDSANDAVAVFVRNVCCFCQCANRFIGPYYTCIVIRPLLIQIRVI